MQTFIEALAIFAVFDMGLRLILFIAGEMEIRRLQKEIERRRDKAQDDGVDYDP